MKAINSTFNLIVAQLQDSISNHRVHLVGQWKLLMNRDGSDLHLYNILADRQEKADLAIDEPTIVTKLSEKPVAWGKIIDAKSK